MDFRWALHAGVGHGNRRLEVDRVPGAFWAKAFGVGREAGSILSWIRIMDFLGLATDERCEIGALRVLLSRAVLQWTAAATTVVRLDSLGYPWALVIGSTSSIFSSVSRLRIRENDFTIPDFFGNNPELPMSILFGLSPEEFSSGGAMGQDDGSVMAEFLKVWIRGTRKN